MPDEAAGAGAPSTGDLSAPNAAEQEREPAPVVAQRDAAQGEAKASETAAAPTADVHVIGTLGSDVKHAAISIGDAVAKFETGEAIHAFVDRLLAAGREAFGNHSGRYQEAALPPSPPPETLIDPESVKQQETHVDG